jgi:hypothetical protein
MQRRRWGFKPKSACNNLGGAGNDATRVAGYGGDDEPYGERDQ